MAQDLIFNLKKGNQRAKKKKKRKLLQMKNITKLKTQHTGQKIH